MSLLTKEMKIIYKNKIFLTALISFTLIYALIGYGSRYIYREVNRNLNVIYYFIYVYSFSLTLIMLQIYPLNSIIREKSSGGLENLLAAGYSLKKLIFSKTAVLFQAIYLPSAVMVIIIIIWSKMYLTGLLALLLILPIINAALSLIYTCTMINNAFPGVIIRQVSFYAVAGIFLMSYGPALLYNNFGYVVDLKVSIILSVIFAVAVLYIAYCKYKKVDVEQIILRSGW